MKITTKMTTKPKKMVTRKDSEDEETDETDDAELELRLLLELDLHPQQSIDST